MAAPAIPPIRPGPIGPELAVGKPTGVNAEQTAAVLALTAGHPDRTFVVGENFVHRNDLRHPRAVLARSESERNGSDTTHTTVLRGVHNGYRAKPVDVVDAVRFGARPVDRGARSAAGVIVVQRALDSADPSSSASFAG